VSSRNRRAASSSTAGSGSLITATRTTFRSVCTDGARRFFKQWGGRNKKQAGWIATAKTLSFKVRHHLKEEEAKFFQLAGRLLSATKKKQLAREYTREIVRMRGHYAAAYETVAIAAASGLVTPAKRAADKPATRGNARTGAQLRGMSEPRRTR
jgi:hypothetical protein